MKCIKCGNPLKEVNYVAWVGIFVEKAKSAYGSDSIPNEVRKFYVCEEESCVHYQLVKFCLPKTKI